jgi:hypothetical protein
MIETTSNVGPAGGGGAGAWLKTWDVNAADSSGNTAILAIGMVSSPIAVRQAHGRNQIERWQ